MGVAVAAEEMSLGEFQRIEYREGVFALRMAKDCLHYGSLRVLLVNIPAVHPPAFHFPCSGNLRSYR